MADEIRFARQIPWFTCYTTIWEREDLDAETKLVYINLAGHAGNNQRAWPSYDTIARETSLSRRCVIDRVKILNNKNLLVKRPRFLANGGQTSNLYIVFPSHEPFNPKKESIDTTGNLVNKPQDVGDAQHTLPDLEGGVHRMHGGGAPHAPKYDHSNNNVVVVKDSTSKKINAEKSLSKKLTYNQKPESLKKELDIKEKVLTPTEHQIQEIIAGIKEVTGTTVEQKDAVLVLSQFPFDYVKEKITEVMPGSNIDQNLTGWLLAACWGDWKKVKPEKLVKSQNDNKRKPQPKSNNISSSQNSKKMELIRSLYMS